MTNTLFKSTFALPTPVVDTAPQVICASDRPLVLLPVRLETRFFQVTGGLELRVRIYPDKIHLDSHETDLRASENQNGMNYWLQDWRAGDDMTARATAWRRFADLYGPARAAWIARALTPTNARPSGPPIPLGTPLPTPPVFPTVTISTNDQDSAWRSPPRARLLPDRWIAILHSGTATPIRVTGKDIVRPVAVGPDPRAVEADTGFAKAAVDAGTAPAIDSGMLWMVDFDKAELIGMALRIPVTPAMVTAGLDNLYVFGVSNSLNATDSSTQLANLLDAHHYTDGLEFLRQGTPSNNTDDRRATSIVDDAAHARSFGNEVTPDASTLNADSNATRLGTAFGLNPARIAPGLARVAQAGDQHDADMRSMNTALWSAGWGYFLSNILGPESTGLTPDVITWARDHFVSSVRAGGPFPVLRCGHQPYGVLPVTSLNLWKPKTGQEAAFVRDGWLKDFLLKLRDTYWRNAMPSVARLGARTTGPGTDADLADVMQTDAISTRYRTQSLFGPHYLSHLRAFFKEDLNASGFFTQFDVVTSKPLSDLGLAINPRVRHSVYAGKDFALTAPLVQAGEVSPWRKLEPNYIKTLHDLTTIQSIIAARPESVAPGSMSLLQTLLRHALLREYADAAARIAGGSNSALVAALQRDAELVDLVRTDAEGQVALQTQTWPRQLASNRPSISPPQLIKAYLEAPDFNDQNVAPIGAFRNSLAHLQDLDSERLQYLMQGTLDLSSYRLDAWITSFATKRLTAMNANGAPGAYVGGYGWVENLVPMTSLVSTAPPLGEQAPIFLQPNDTGFIHAPSATHAAAAALLRNAHLGALGTPDATSPFAIDLSSRRVREAERLLDGVRQGQPLSALLGYRFERSLHDLSLDYFIAPLRALAPLVASPLQAGGAPAATIAANNVVDGQVLARKWRDGRADVTTLLQTVNGQQVPPIPANVDKAKQELDMLADAIDGVSDALTAETAYQMARGNTSRVASALAALTTGSAPPPELEVAHMPRTGTVLTHRVMAVFSGTGVGAPAWGKIVNTYRSLCEPLLAAWVSLLMGDPRRARCTVERLDDVTGAVVETRTFLLYNLFLSGLDFVYSAEDGSGATESPGSLSEDEMLVLYYAKHVADGFDVNANIRLNHERPTDLAAGEITLFDLLEQARAIKRLLNGVRGLDPEDLNPPERTTQCTIDLVELEARVVRAEAGLNGIYNSLNQLVTRPGTAEAFRSQLMNLRSLGLGPMAIPMIASGESPEAIAALLRQSKGILPVALARLNQGAALRAVPVATDPRARRDQLVDRMRAVFGQSYVVLPHILCDAASGAELTAALAASTATQGGDALAVNTWFTRSSRVRDRVARVGACLRTADILTTGDRLNLSVAQLPFSAGSPERWVGLPPLPGTTIPVSKLSLVVHTTAPLDTTLPITGLLLDEWTEVVPSTRETTALTFQYNPPDAAAPQSVLVAVPPVPDQDWTVETLHRVLMETLDLAKLRGVTPESLGGIAHYIPALYLGFNVKDDAVSTDFTPLTQ